MLWVHFLLSSDCTATTYDEVCSGSTAVSEVCLSHSQLRIVSAT